MEFSQSFSCAVVIGMSKRISQLPKVTPHPEALIPLGYNGTGCASVREIIETGFRDASSMFDWVSITINGLLTDGVSPVSVGTLLYDGMKLGRVSFQTSATAVSKCRWVGFWECGTSAVAVLNPSGDNNSFSIVTDTIGQSTATVSVTIVDQKAFTVSFAANILSIVIGTKSFLQVSGVTNPPTAGPLTYAGIDVYGVPVWSSNGEVEAPETGRWVRLYGYDLNASLEVFNYGTPHPDFFNGSYAMSYAIDPTSGTWDNVGGSTGTPVITLANVTANMVISKINNSDVPFTAVPNMGLGTGAMAPITATFVGGAKWTSSANVLTPDAIPLGAWSASANPHAWRPVFPATGTPFLVADKERYTVGLGGTFGNFRISGSISHAGLNGIYPMREPEISTDHARYYKSNGYSLLMNTTTGGGSILTVEGQTVATAINVRGDGGMAPPGTAPWDLEWVFDEDIMGTPQWGFVSSSFVDASSFLAWAEDTLPELKALLGI